MVDGAHNLGALQAFAESICEFPGNCELPVVIFSVVSDKKYEQMIDYLCQKVKAKLYIVTEIDDRRRVPADELGELFRKCTSSPVYVRGSIRDAVESAYEMRGNSEIYCLGSLYLVGAVKKYFTGGERQC